MQKAFEEIIEKLEEKIKVTSLEIIVTGTKDKPYFEIKYKELGKEDYSIGYSSYDLKNVFGWKEECFEIVNQVAVEYVPDTNIGSIGLDAWEKVYKRILELEKEYFEAGDVKNSDELIELSNLLRHYKEQLTEESDSTSFNDWIPCSVKMPNEPEIGMLDIECLQEYNVMIEGADAATTLYYAGDGEWYDFITGTFYKVIAWQPLPPYQPKGE